MHEQFGQAFSYPDHEGQRVLGIAGGWLALGLGSPAAPVYETKPSDQASKGLRANARAIQPDFLITRITAERGFSVSPAAVQRRALARPGCPLRNEANRSSQQRTSGECTSDSARLSYTRITTERGFSVSRAAGQRWALARPGRALRNEAKRSSQQRTSGECTSYSARLSCTRITTERGFSLSPAAVQRCALARPGRPLRNEAKRSSHQRTSGECTTILASLFSCRDHSGRRTLRVPERLASGRPWLSRGVPVYETKPSDQASKALPANARPVWRTFSHTEITTDAGPSVPQAAGQRGSWLAGEPIYETKPSGQAGKGMDFGRMHERLSGLGIESSHTESWFLVPSSRQRSRRNLVCLTVSERYG
jgi:hypothetical protein